MEKYRFLEHTADAKFQAYGETLEEAFSNAALATASLMWDPERVKKAVEHNVRVKGRDLKQLLCIFLEEILYLLDTESFLLGSVEKVKIEKRGEYLLEAIFHGDHCADTYEIYGDVKAVTYSEMEIRKDRRVTLQVVVDM